MPPNYSLFIGIEITTLSIALICFALRLGNHIVKKMLTLYDVILIFATAMAITMTSMVFRLYYLHYGSENIPEENNTPIGQLSLTLFSIFPLCYSLIRISILLTYLKLFPGRTNGLLCWGLCAAQLIYSTWAALATALQCKPIESYWTYAEGRICTDPQNQDVAILVINSIFDLITYSWPVQYLYNLQMPKKNRIELIVAFGIGLVNLGLSFSRLGLLIVMYKTEDYYRYGIWGIMIIVVESHVGITCACLPYLRFIIEFFFTTCLSNMSTPFSMSNPTKPKPIEPDHNVHPSSQLSENRNIKKARQSGIEFETYHAKGSEEELHPVMGNTSEETSSPGIWGGPSTVSHNQPGMAL